MPTNIEIKARVRDFTALQARAAQLSGSSAEVIPQVDTFYSTRWGRLKLRELRTGVAQLIYYERADQDGPKRSDYQIFETRDAAGLKSVLKLALGVRGTVNKVRYLYMIGHTRVHLDDVENLGQFLELEVMLQPGESEAQGQATAESLILQLGIDRADLLESAYMDLMERRD